VKNRLFFFDLQQKKIQKRVDQEISVFNRLLKTQRYNLMMLNMSQWLYNQEWRHVMSLSEQENLKTPIIYYAKKQLDLMLKGLKNALGSKLELTFEDYSLHVAHIRRSLDTGLFFGSLFDTQKHALYRKKWMHIINGIRDLLMNDYITRLDVFYKNSEKETLQEKQSSEEMIRLSLEKLNAPSLKELKELRIEVFKMKGYWV
jgi:inorganic triphosphatase YgiF